MSAPILRVEKVGKSYRNYNSELHRFLSWFSTGCNSFEDNWILQNISFAICSGEAIGIVGRNGAGKSTLLKMITGTLIPTTGEISTNCKISAILELGMGFNPELSGLQNAIHACGLMGHDGAAIKNKMAEIEDFADIGEYFLQPVRLYSSGMQMRLAFSVATAFRPDVLIVDEALSVGDAYFQHKSFERIRQFQNMGTTLLIVSHDRASILALCNRVILLEKGCVLMDGDPEEVMDYYNALIAEAKNSKISQITTNDKRTQTISGNGAVVFEDIVLLDRNGRSIEMVEVGDPVTLRLTVRATENLPELVLGYMVKNRLGQTMFGTNTYYHDQVLSDVKENQCFTFNLKFPVNLGAGSYSVTIAAHEGCAHAQTNYEWRDLALIFNVVNSSHNEFVGCNWLEPTITIDTQ